MLRRIGTRVWMTALAFAVAGGLYLGAPPERVQAAGDCGAYDGKVCSATTECVYILFYKICTTRSKYYQTDPEEMI